MKGVWIMNLYDIIYILIFVLIWVLGTAISAFLLKHYGAIIVMIKDKDAVNNENNSKMIKFALVLMAIFSFLFIMSSCLFASFFWGSFIENLT